MVGDYPTRVLTLSIGDRRPLGIGAGGLALLAFRSQAEIEALMRDKPDLPYPSITLEEMRYNLAEAQRTSYAFNPARAHGSAPDLFPAHTDGTDPSRS